MAAVRGGVLPGPILERADIGSSHPGLTAADLCPIPGGPSELTPTVTEVIFVRSRFLPVCYKCTETVRTE